MPWHLYWVVPGYQPTASAASGYASGKLATAGGELRKGTGGETVVAGDLEVPGSPTTGEILDGPATTTWLHEGATGAAAGRPFQ